MNQVTLAGHLGADPEVRFTPSGQKVTMLRVAAKCRRTSKGDEVIWWRVSVWGEQFDKIISYFKKGNAILVVGELMKPEIFTDREGKQHISMNLTAYHLYFTPFGRSSESGNAAEGGAHHSAPSGEMVSFEGVVPQESFYGMGKALSPDEEIPF